MYLGVSSDAQMYNDDDALLRAHVLLQDNEIEKRVFAPAMQGLQITGDEGSETRAVLTWEQ